MGTEPFSNAFSATTWTVADILFKWVPASVASLMQTVQSPNGPTEAISAWGVPSLLAGAGSGPLYDSLVQAWVSFALFSFAISAPFIGIIVFSMIRTWQIRRGERAAFAAMQEGALPSEAVSTSKRRWDRILGQIASDNPDDWRLAVLEADIMLSELLDLRGYRGETIADKMKQVDRADFNTIDLAWEAHRYRNKVAHETTTASLEYREVRRVIDLYERVFNEFNFMA